MFRHMVFPMFLITLFTVLSNAQATRDKATERVRSDPYLTSDSYAAYAKVGAADSRISIARLREPPKAQQLYNKALKAWKGQRPAEAQRRLLQALKVYPAFPEALTFYGGIQTPSSSGDRRRII